MKKPNFLVLGAPKCGTTSMYYYLNQHKDIFLCSKEVHFFAYGDDLYEDIVVQEWEKYLDLFEEAENEEILGEVAVRYLYSDVALNKIKKYIPDAKLMVLLRDPAERAFSHFLMRFRTGGLVAEKGTVPGEEDIREGFSNNRDYIERSRYYKYIERYLKKFPKENMHFVVLDDLKNDPISVLSGIFEFLGVDENVEIDTSRKYNVSTVDEFSYFKVLLRRSKHLRSLRASKTLRWVASKIMPRSIIDWMLWRKSTSKSIKNQVEMPPDVRKKLINYYEGDIDGLENLMSRDLSSWKQVDKS